MKSGTLAIALCAALLCDVGCLTRRTLELDAQNPAVSVTTSGVMFGDRKVRPEEVPDILGDYGVPRTQVIHIHLDPAVRDLRPARYLMTTLARAGYTRPVLVTRRHAESQKVTKGKGLRNG